MLQAVEWPNAQESLDEARKEAATGLGPQPKGGKTKGDKVPGTTRRSISAPA